MKKIARRKSTLAWINDFQELATAEVLVRNAIVIGIPAEDVEVVDVSDEDFETIKEEVIAPLRLIAEQEAALTRDQLITVGQAVKTKLGITTDQLKLFVRFMREIDIDSF